MTATLDTAAPVEVDLLGADVDQGEPAGPADRVPRWPWFLAAVALLQYVVTGLWLVDTTGFLIADGVERTANAMMDLVGETQFIWGSDYPHIDSSIDAPHQIRASAAGLSEHRRRLLLGENARELFRL